MNNKTMTDKEQLERIRMALEAILQLESYHSVDLAKKMAKTALQGR